MDSIFETSDENCSQYKGFFTEEQEREREVTSSKGNKVLLTLLGLSLVFALGGLCALWVIYNHKVADFESQNEQHIINSTVMMRELEELKTNYTGVREQLLLHVAMKKEFNNLTARYNKLRERMSFYDAHSCNLSGDGWIPCRGKMYLFSSNELDWQSSRDVCVSKGADLVTITSQSEQDFLVSKMYVAHWIGLHDLDTEGHWVWVNNRTLNETGVQFWFTGDPKQPNNRRNHDPSGENCACLGDVKNHLDSWFDTSCKTQKTFICEKEY
ncbi:CD209 antigen-like protein E [Pseudorasbora parva]|uniref:CD209 antigen-like protein E n=1 Tax=Pseudorasbora parva TaxID=51549 RepID=UPI00351F2381